MKIHCRICGNAPEIMIRKGSDICSELCQAKADHVSGPYSTNVYEKLETGTSHRSHHNSELPPALCQKRKVIPPGKGNTIEICYFRIAHDGPCSFERKCRNGSS